MEAAEAAKIYETGGFRIDAGQRVLWSADGARTSLSSRAFDLLLFFVRHPGELLEKDRLMAAVWPDTVVEENNLNQCIGALRKALGESAGERRFLVNEPGRGYRFVAPVRTSSSAELPLVHRPSPRRWTWILGVVACLAAALFWWWRASDSPATAVDRSIAVLPFENHSTAPENEYLALGVQDEILTLLTRVGDLRVIPRNSTQRYAGSTASAREIGGELGVAYLLSGAVQRSGDRVRVNVTLLDAAGDQHLWASTYERSTSEVFAIESEVAQAVARALEARLTDEEHQVITRPPTANPAAYDAYLRARGFAERTTRTENEIRSAIAAFEDAVRLDPDFAIAWAQLSRRHANFYSLGYDRSPARREAAEHALAEATRLRPDLIETKAARGYFLFVVAGDIEGSATVYRELESQYPGSADVAAGLAQTSHELGQMERTKDYNRRVIALDPLNPYRHSIICQDYATASEFELALQTCHRALELLPGDIGILAIMANIYQSRGMLEQARSSLRSLDPAAGDWRTLRVMSRQYLLDREPRAAVALLEKYLANPDALGTRKGAVRRWLADALRLAGDPDAAEAVYATANTELTDEWKRQPENPLLVADLAIVHARLGNQRLAGEFIHRCEELAARSRRQAFIAECLLAKIQVSLAQKSPNVVHQLEEALARRGEFPPLTVALIALDPEFDGLRARPDFQALR